MRHKSSTNEPWPDRFRNDIGYRLSELDIGHPSRRCRCYSVTDALAGNSARRSRRRSGGIQYRKSIYCRSLQCGDGFRLCSIEMIAMLFLKRIKCGLSAFHACHTYVVSNCCGDLVLLRRSLLQDLVSWRAWYGKSRDLVINNTVSARSLTRPH